MRRPRTAVLGARHWHVPLHVSAWGDTHDVVLVQDEEPDQVTDIAGRLDAAVYGEVGESLDAGPLDLAYVFVPHDRMVETCLALVERGIPFVVEKPGGTGPEDVERIRDAAAAAGVAATVPFVQRGGPVDHALSLAGAPTYQRTSFVAGPPQRYHAAGCSWMLDPARSGGGCLVNLAPHFIDIFLRRSRARRVELVAANVSASLHGEGVEDHATLVLAGDDGSEAIIEVGYAFPSSPAKRYCSFTSAGSEGYVDVGTSGHVSFTHAADGVTESSTIEVDSDPLYDVFVRQVADTWADGFAGLPTLDDLADTMSLIWAAYGRSSIASLEVSHG
ncbi:MULTISPECIES: Gfo/Idh/MocA family oxidoreductase [unclassified Streptomyces]|uniref:Gfo/Idh/MocA family protein n=1 Tax=unclassified Streptomyces TaxID=2593676 RepID=UPI002DDBA05A|nr:MULTISPECIES: Gfo/Idh/MocA family oxidoreductase [unclassified Streptomyces]WSA90538.1 Gfo/Idh/MocA family oxidoreductase [Streptomyces sp. NBC_01795]WSB74863.1 Gfo/Idh/MocA family oxidoreductase [Streptomyces sp. NBC_01775]WSS16854.1 Gfo/Idh/MocA family oxidoreductase [Streptomyces sp. NBC_01186]WSS45596.1 Gfo/Idh/MocA family oxidoreductase [Streptomyces sp. NBC_01187]